MCARAAPMSTRMPRFSKPDTRVHDALRRIGPLPVLGGTVARIRTLADDPNGSTSDLVTVIESDEAFAANLLRYANSAANARPIRARTIRQAVTLLGRRALVRIALEAATYRFLERFPGGAHLSRGQLHVHAVTVAAYAYTTADLRGAHTDTAHLAGLLHDVGKLLMPAAFGVQALEDIAAAEPVGPARAALERKRLGLDHAAAGALLVGLSEPDDDVTRAIAYHHGGPTGLACPSAEAACVQVADAVAHLLAGNEIDRTLLGIALERLEAGPELLDEVAERAGVAPAGAGGRARGRRRPAGGGRPHRRPDRPAQPPLLARHRPPRARHGHRGHAADLRHRQLQGRQRRARPPGRRPRPGRGRARARPPRRRRAARRRRVRRLGVGRRGPADRRRRSSRTSSARSRSSSSRARRRWASRSAPRRAAAT